ncbi:MAG TPA: DUF6130 family protein [Allosphingosinicella sp.]
MISNFVAATSGNSATPRRKAVLAVVVAGLAAWSLGGANPARAQTIQAPASPFVPLKDEPPPKLYVDPPLAAPLARGAAIIPYRTENFRILPVFGPAATQVSPRAGHLHVTVDDLPWRWADAGDNRSVVVVGLPAGLHKVRIELATPEHGVIAGQSVTFAIPPAPPAASGAR